MAAKKKSKWIKGATANAHGQFAAKAAKAGESTLEFAHKHDEDAGRLGKQAVLAENLIAAGRKRSSSRSREDRIKSRYGASHG